MAEKKRRIAGIDYGRKRIGLSLSDESQTIASALPTFHVGGKMESVVQELAVLLGQHALEAVVVGNPLKLSGKTSMMGDEVAYFVSLLQPRVACPLVLWDERLTTCQAERMLKEANMNRKKRSKVVDSVAAVILLQNYLDYRKVTQQSPVA